VNLLTLLKKPTLPKHQQAEEPDLELEVDIGCEDLYVNQLIQSGRYCLVLLPDDQWSADDMTLAAAWKAIQHYMALVPAGDTVLAPVVSSPQPHDLQRAMSAQSVDATYLDRYAVTNADFERFV
jgi:formylglycine-generating enzyme required for sulfatase activity